MHGDIRLGDTIDIQFTTRQFSTGLPFLLAGSPVISAYIDNGTTELTAGITLSTNFDGRAGLNNVRIVATSGNGYAAGTNVSLVITTGTVDSISVVGECIGSFSIEKRSALMPTTAGRTLAVESDGMGHADVKEWLGTAPLSLSSQQVQAVVPNTQKVDVETVKTRAVTAAGAVVVGGFVGQDTAAIGVNASGHVSRTTLTDTATTLTNDPTGVGTLLTRMGTPSNLGGGATVAANLADIEAQTDDIGAAGAGLTAIPDSAGVGTLLTRVGTPSNLGGGATVAANLADIESQTDDIGVAGAGLSALPAVTVGTNNDKTGYGLADGAITAAKIAADAITSAKVQDGFLTAAKFASGAFDAVWSVAARLLTAGTNIVLAKGVGVTGFNDLSAAQVNAEVDTALADAGVTTTVTGRIDAAISTRATPAQVATELATYDGPTHAELTAELATADDAVLAQVAFVKSVTDKLDDTVEDDGGTYRFTANALEEAPTGGSAPTVGQIADAVWDEPTSGHTTSGTFGEQLKTDVDAILSTLTSAASEVTSILGKFTGITLLAQWLGLIAGKQTGNSTARTELRATGGGSGTYDETTDSQEALRDRGDAAWADSGTPPTAAAIATQVRTELTTELGRIDAATSTRATPAQVATELATYDAPTKAELDAAILTLSNAIAALNNLSAAQVTAAVPTATQNADAYLKRDMSAVTGEAARSPLNAHRFQRNRWEIAGGVLTVYKEDDTTIAWTAPVTQTAGDPISAMDPA